MITQSMVREDGSQMTLIHYLMPTDAGLRIACTPNATLFSAQAAGRTSPILRTDEPRAATCPLCRETDEWVAAMGEQR